MKIVAMTGDSPRHLAMAHALCRSGRLAALIVQTRESRFPEFPVGSDESLKALFKRHFEERDQIERAFFRTQLEEIEGPELLRVTPTELNGERVHQALRKHIPDLLISYGVSKLSSATLAVASKGRTWNIHGGLSPWYRGCITHFWPTYMLEPQMTGMTVHELTARLDGGDIIHQAVAPLVRGDGVHHTACRAVQALIEEWPKLIELASADRLKPPVPQKSSGKLWMDQDWRPEHLRAVYELYRNRVVDAYLDGKLEKREPDLVRQF